MLLLRILPLGRWPSPGAACRVRWLLRALLLGPVGRCLASVGEVLDGDDDGDC